MEQRRAPEIALGFARRFGSDAVSFLAVESGMRHWVGEGVGGEACVAYVDTGSAWVAAGAPLAPGPRVGEAAATFLEEARTRGRRACFFASEGSSLDGFARVLIGQQPIWNPAEWPGTLGRHRRLREQLRRVRAKGLRVRRVGAGELSVGSTLRGEIDALVREWLSARRMASMAFLVALEPFCFAEEHRYFVAEQGGRVVAFLSAVPIYAENAWFVEDFPRKRGAPNGTVEVLIDALMRDVPDARFVTLGLAPLAGPVTWWLRVARFAGRPLYDFRGLHEFKKRLRPVRWQDVWLMHPIKESPVVHVIESLRAFSGGSLVVFGVRSLVRHPSGPLLALAVPLVPWTLLLAALAMTTRAELLGFSRGALALWALFDAALLAQLLWSAMRPRPKRLVLSAALACFDATFSIRHLAWHGLGETPMRVTLRAVATLAPCMGAAILSWVAVRALVQTQAARFRQVPGPVRE